MNPTRINCQRDIKMKEEHCISQCMQVLKYEYIKQCEYWNKPNDFKYYHLLNGYFKEILEIYTQIKSNHRRREEQKLPCDPITC